MSTGTTDSTSPVKPPSVNMKRKPHANSIGVSKVSEPFHVVATQLTTFTPVGTAMIMVAYMKNSCPVTGMPTVYTVSHTHLRAHETPEHLVCRLLLEKKKTYVDR